VADLAQTQAGARNHLPCAYMSGQLARASEMANKSGITVGIKLTT